MGPSDHENSRTSPPSSTSQESHSNKEKAIEVEEREKYPTWKFTLPVLSSLWVVLFLVALDGTVISTAVPSITSQFHSVDNVGWYSSIYTMTRCAFILFWSKLYSFYNPKWVLISATTLFEIGSALCGSAPTSPVLILGRAVAGVGAAGIFTGSLVAVNYMFPLEKRPIIMAILGVNFRLSTILGPLIGGVLTDKLSWRWCFYINLPFGNAGLLMLLFLLNLPSPMAADGGPMPLRQQLLKLDPLGFITFVPSIISLLLALEWGGTTYAWSNPIMIVLLVIFAFLFACFVAVQLWLKESGTVPPRIARQRSIACAMWYSVANGGAVTTVAYYLPMWFQVIEGTSATESGVSVLPNAVATIIGALATGVLTSRIGYYAPFMISSSVFMAVGSGLLTTLSPVTPSSKRILYQIVCGLGAGGGSAQANVAVLAVLEDKKDAAVGQGLILFGNLLGSAVFIAVGQNIFSTLLLQDIKTVPGLNYNKVLDAGATGLRSLGLSGNSLQLVLDAYNRAITSIFFVTVGLACSQLLGTAGMEWKSVKKNERNKKTEMGAAVLGGEDMNKEGVTDLDKKDGHDTHFEDNEHSGPDVDRELGSKKLEHDQRNQPAAPTA
ncbi:MFS general substrate transporter [Lepidopterella palustris CBS 459.81]|uniref:MFS general substrate transporter n=1 Tax=Lepidopterella palustris CBS 459.81 TaxID=1314670 RepID=A0A8E2J8S8_9PEZI|nr:MFS general substrate transporter [Lepidopterella palustris CBS 459.81]